MKEGRTLQELAVEIKRQSENKADFLASTETMVMEKQHNPNAPAVRLRLGTDHAAGYGPNDVAHGQIAEFTKIPRAYYDRCLAEEPELLATNVNRWFQKYPKVRMVRTLDGYARGFLSDGYRPLENIDLANLILPSLMERKLQIMSCEITDRRLYIKAVDEQLFKDVPVGFKMGDGSHQIFRTCAPAVIVSNSEVGYGRLLIETGIYDRGCTNLGLWSDGAFKKTHIGARHKLTEDVTNIDHLLTDETKRKTDAAIWSQVRDVIGGAFSDEAFERRAEKLTHAAGQKITGKVEKVVKLAAKHFALTDTESESVLKWLIDGASLTQWGLHAAITRTAQDADTYDRATELEYAGGSVIELPANDWRRMAEAA